MLNIRNWNKLMRPMINGKAATHICVICGLLNSETADKNGSHMVVKINEDLIRLYNEYYRIGQAKAQMKIYKAAKDNIIAHIEKEVHRLFSEINKGAFNAQAKCPSLASLYNPDLYDNIIKNNAMSNIPVLEIANSIEQEMLTSISMLAKNMQISIAKKHEIIIFPNGDKYHGNVKNGQMDGEGTYQAKDLECFVGHFKENQRYGPGVHYLKNKDEIEGFWEGDQCIGNATMRGNQSNSKYYGQIANGMRNGYGILYTNTSVLEGEWMNDYLNGKATCLIYDNNSKSMNDEMAFHTYRGNTTDSLIDGYGIMEYSNGQVYIGYWKMGQREGKGKLFSKEGAILYDGVWVTDKKLVK
jgi:hypothetical protein